MGEVHLIPSGVGVYVAVFLVRAFPGMLLLIFVCVVFLVYVMCGSAPILVLHLVGLAIVCPSAQGVFL